jgi:hypothetical protein
MQQSEVMQERIKLPEEVAQESFERVKQESVALLNIIDIWCSRLDPLHQPVPRKGDRSALLLQWQSEEQALQKKLEAKHRSQQEESAKVNERIEEHLKLEEQQSSPFASLVDASVDNYHLKNHYKNLQSELQRLQRYSYLEEIYRIEILKDFAVVNGVPMGTSDEPALKFKLEDTSFGFGHMLSMITNILTKLKLEIPRFKPLPDYNKSLIKFDGQVYELFITKNDFVGTDHAGGLLSSDRRLRALRRRSGQEAQVDVGSSAPRQLPGLKYRPADPALR